jgi:DNA-binding NtrC family response regulator
MTETNVVIADIDISMAADVASVVEEMGCRVFLKEDLDEVVEVFRKWDIGMLIIDTSMLERDGLEVINMLRGLKRDIPIIVTTSTPSKEVEREIRSCGVIYYAPKPVDFYWIKEIVRRSLSKDRLHRSRT